MSLHSFSRRLVAVGRIAVSGFVVATTAAQANPPIIVNCNGGGQICNQMARYNFTSESPNFDYALQVTAPATHCSEVKYFTTNRQGQRVETEFLGPNRSAFLPIGDNWPQGNHPIQIGAIGRQGGCNAGTLGSWGVQVRPVVVPR